LGDVVFRLGVECWCVDSDEFVKANVTSLSTECRDLLDKIFIADELQRITLQVA
jgi:hypothetical protein